MSLRTSGRLLYESRKQLSGLIAILLLLAGSLSSAQNSANGLIYHGRVLKPNGDAMEDNNVRFEVRIYGREALPVAKRCLLYQEEHTGISMVGSKGSFEIKVGEGTRLFAPPEVPGASGIGRLFLNSPSFTLTTTTCNAGTNDFTAESLDADREIEVTIQSGATTLALPAQKMRAMPWAMQAMEIGGYSADYLAKMNAPISAQVNAANLMFLTNGSVISLNDNGTPTNYSDDTARLQNLIDPTNPQDAATKAYVDLVAGGFAAGNGIDITAGTVTTKIDNTTIEFDGTGIMRIKALGVDTAHLAAGSVTASKLNQMGATPGQVLKWNGAAWAPDSDVDTDTGITSVSYSDLNSAGATVNDGMIVKDATGRLFNKQCAANQVVAWSVANGWDCINPSSLVGVQASALAQNNIWVGNAGGVAAAQALPTCAAGQYLAYDGTSWSCSAPTDNNTTYTAGDALNLTATDFDVNVDDVGIEINADALRLKDGGVTSAKIADGTIALADLNAMGAVNGQVLKYNGTNWTVANDSGITAIVGQGLAQHSIWQGDAGGLAAVVAIPSCGANQYLKYNNAGGWTCENDAGAAGSVASAQGTAPVKVNGDNAAHTGAVTITVDDATAAAKGVVQVGTGLAVAAGVVSVPAPTCAAGNYISFDGTNWSCSVPTDTNTTYTAGDALDLTAGDFDVKVDDLGIEVNADALRLKDGGVTSAKIADGTIALADFNAMGAVNGQVLKYNGTNWTVANDAGITAIVGQTLAQHSIWQGDAGGVAAAVAIPSCGANQLLKYNNVTGWTCENDAGAAGTVASVASTGPIKVNGGTAAQTGAVTVTVDDATAAAKGVVQVGTGLAVAAGVVSVPAPTCAAGNYISFDGTNWSCSVPTDTNTTYTAGDALTLTANDFDVAVDDVGIEINADAIRLKDGGVTSAKIADGAVSFVDLNAAGATVNDGMIVKDSSGRLFNKQCAANQVVAWSVANGWDCINPSALVGVQSTALAQHSIWQGNAGGTAAAVAIPSCGANQYLKYNNAGGWTCENDAGAGGGLTSLNTLTAATQTFATGTAGTDFGISSAGSTHTFNIPTASATNRGALSSADWTTFNDKLGTGLASLNIWVGSAGGVATAVNPSGDVDINNAGVMAIQSDVIVDADINSAANINASKLGTGVVDNTEFNYLNGVTSAIQGQIDGKITNVAGTPSIQTGTFATMPAFGTAGRIYIASDTNAIYRDTGAAWVLIGDGTGSSYTAGDALTLTANDFDVAVDNVGIEVNADALRLRDGGVTSAKIADGTIALADFNAMGAANGQVLKFDGTNWTVANDAGITAVAGQPLAQHSVWLGNGSNVAAVSTLPNCGANQYLKYDNTNGWTCNADAGAGGGLTSLNTLTAASQTFATGTAGTDFGISSAGSTHTFNIPTASATNRGALSSADWTTFNDKLGTGLASLNIWVGSAGGVATAVNPSGDVDISNTGVMAIQSDVIVDADINSAANINASKLGTGVVDNTEFNYLNGVTSAIQGQIDGKVSKAGDTMSGNLVHGTNTGSVYNNTANTFGATVRAPSGLAANYTLVLPVDDGTANQVLQTDGAGVLSWASALTNTLNNNNILVGNGSNIATAVDPSGDVDISNTGVMAIQAGVIVDADVNAAANITASKLGTGVVDNTEFNYLNGVTAAIQGQIDGKITNVAGTPSIQTGTFATMPAFGTAGRIYIASDTNAIYRDTGSAWVLIGDGGTTYTAGDALTLTANDFDVAVDNVGIEINADALRLRDGGVTSAKIADGAVSFVDLNAAGATVNDGMIVKDSSGRLFNKQCAANQVVAWSVANGWDCINPSALVGVQSTALAQHSIWQGNAGGTAAAVAIPSCGANQYLKYNNAGGWTCENDAGAGGGLTSLNTLTAATQTFATGTAGTDFGISSAGSTHTFNIPTASGTNRGALSSADWTTFNNKLGTGLTDSFLWMGNGSNVATAVNPSGDVDISNTGVMAIQAGVIVDADVNAAANITATKLGTGVVDNTEFNYLNGVTSAIQGQIDGKVAKAGDTMSGNLVHGTNTGSVYNNTANTFGVTVRAPSALAANYTLVLPVDDGTPNQVLQTDGAGVLTWATASGGGAPYRTGGDGTYPTDYIINTTQPASIPAAAEGNLAIGRDALAAINNATSDWNTAVGYWSMKATTSGQRNSGLGAGSLEFNTTGNSNTAIGVDALNANTVGADNTAIGSSALAAQTGAGLSGNTAVGAFAGTAMTAASNTMVGAYSASNATSSAGIAAVGASTLYALTTGNEETAMGHYALRYITTGSTNTALGYQAGINANTTSSQNVFLGSNSGPAALSVVTSKLFIDNAATNYPLIGGDFTNASEVVNIHGHLEVKPNSATGSPSDFRFYEDGDNGTNYMGFRAPATLAGNVVWELPAADGTANQVLQTNGSGVLSWAAALTSSLTNNNILIGNGSNVATAVDPSGDVDISNTGVMAIQAGVIVDADVNAAANITATKLGTGAIDNTEFNYLDGVTSSIQTQLGARVLKAGDTMSGNLIHGTNTGSVYNNTANTFGATVRAPSGLAANYTLVLPVDDGTANQVLQTDGSGVLSWTNQSSGVGGSGTANKIPKFTAGTTLGDSQITDNGAAGVDFANSKVQLGGALFLHKYGTDNTFFGLNSGNETLTGTDNTAFGANTLDALTTGYSNFALGESALTSLTTGYGNIALGKFALQTATNPYRNIAIGENSLRYLNNAAAHSNVAIGMGTLTQTNNSAANVAIGRGSMGCLGSTSTACSDIGSGGNQNVSIGYQAGYYAYGNSAGNIFIGYQAGPTSAVGSTTNNKLYIDNSENNTPLIYGDFATDTLTINGTILGKPATSNGSATINFGSGNLQYTTSNCGAFNLHNMKDGASYSFAVQGTTVATCSFNAFSDAGTTALTMHLPPDHGPTTNAKHTMYTFVVMGTHVYAAWIPGY